MRQSDSPEEQPPSFTRHLRHRERVFTSISLHLPEHRNKAGAKRKLCYAVFPPLRPEADNHSLQINVTERQASLAKPATLLPRNQVTDAHPLRLVVECLENLAMLCFGDARLTWRGVALHTQALAWINGRKAALHGFVHNYSKQLQLIEGVILAALITAYISMTTLAPINERSNVLTSELARNENVVDFQESSNVPPHSDVASESFQSVSVSLSKEFRNPRAPHRTVKSRAALFSRSKITAESVRLAAFERNRVAKPCRFLAALPANVGVFDPKKGTTRSLVEGSHINRKNYAWLRRKNRRKS